MTLTTTLGYPRIGNDRELKKATEAYWKGSVAEADLQAAANALRREMIEAQHNRHLDLIPSNDFSLYDQMLDTAVMLGVIPSRYGWKGGAGVRVDLRTYFEMARGAARVVACEMTKWFDTNYHYLVPEPDGRWSLTSNRALEEFQIARDLSGMNTKPILIGPFTFVALSKPHSTKGRSELIRGAAEVYATVIGQLAEAGAEWIELQEPALVMDRTEADLALLAECYELLATHKGTARLLLQTYFGDVADIYQRLVELPVQGIGFDLVRGSRTLEALGRHGFPSDKFFGAGVINGRNIWRADLHRTLETLEHLTSVVSPGRLILQPGCSLMHVPLSARLESGLPADLRSWLAFAEEKLDELRVLARAIDEGREAVGTELEANRALIESRRRSPSINDPKVKERLSALTSADFRRESEAERHAAQSRHIGLPAFPTTTIGSFPQTDEVRKMRSRFKSGTLAEAGYRSFIEGAIRKVIDLQEEIGLDVLVHGEFERSDMVEYFGEQLRGFAFTKHAWVQSYGTRYVRPPVIFGDVSRPSPMTVRESVYAQHLTDKPVKGMLTGPVTILNWSFPREDVTRKEVAIQIALALRDETLDLEKAGIRVIQIDEPAFREGLPLKRCDWDEYLRWAVRAFRLASSGVGPQTQIHSHMCYSEFNDIIKAISDLDADVISIENSRSAGELLEAFRDFRYSRGIGPGVYDVHSERVPSVQEMQELLERTAKVIDPSLIWVNPDCGLKTRGYDETVPALINLVAAARAIRARGSAVEECV